MKNLTMKEAQKILDDAPQYVTHFYVSRLLKMGEVAYFSKDKGGVFVADEWVIYEMALGGEYGILCELREMLRHGKREEAIDPIVAAVCALKGNIFNTFGRNNKRDTHVLLCEDGDYITDTLAGHDDSLFTCTIEEFNQYAKEMTGCVAVHQEWLAKVNAIRDMSEDDNKELIEQIKTIEHVMAVQQKSINWLVDSQAELLAEKQKLERLI